MRGDYRRRRPVDERRTAFTTEDTEFTEACTTKIRDASNPRLRRSSPFHSVSSASSVVNVLAVIVRLTDPPRLFADADVS